MNMQIREIAKTADLKVAYSKDGLDVRVCVMNIEFHIVIIPGLFEPPVRTLRATIPENESHIFR